MQRTCARAVHWSVALPLCQWGSPSFGILPKPFKNSKYDICNDVLGMITWRSDRLDDRLLIWNWKMGTPLVNMVRALPPHISIGRIHLIYEYLIVQPI